MTSRTCITLIHCSSIWKCSRRTRLLFHITIPASKIPNICWNWNFWLFGAIMTRGTWRSLRRDCSNRTKRSFNTVLSRTWIWSIHNRGINSCKTISTSFTIYWCVAWIKIRILDPWSCNINDTVRAGWAKQRWRYLWRNAANVSFITFNTLNCPRFRAICPYFTLITLSLRRECLKCSWNTRNWRGKLLLWTNMTWRTGKLNSFFAKASNRTIEGPVAVFVSCSCHCVARSSWCCLTAYYSIDAGLWSGKIPFWVNVGFCSLTTPKSIRTTDWAVRSIIVCRTEVIDCCITYQSFWTII